MKLSVIVPAYNQGEYIYRNMHEMLKTLFLGCISKRCGKNINRE